MNKKFFRSPATIFLISVMLFSFASCDEDGKFNMFSIEEEITLGEEFTQHILDNPEEYPILDKDQYPEVYEYVYRIRDEILASKDIRYKDRFSWDIYIIDQDVFNAFAVPGGNTFYYTGLIKFLDDEASLAGVMAHEIAHADRRHSSERLTEVYKYQLVASLLFGNNPTLIQGILTDLAIGGVALQYSRKFEFEADEFAVRYMYPTQSDSRGVAYFFQKIDSEARPGWLTYFSTHPPDKERIDAIMELHTVLGGKEGNLFSDRYQAFKKLLP